MNIASFTSIQSLTTLGEEMRAAADKYPTDIKPVYSNTEVEAMERTPIKVRTGKWMQEVGLSRVIRYHESIISVCISLELFEEKPHYRLSLCHLTGPMTFGPLYQPDAAWVAICVLGVKAKAVPNPSGIEHAKHFVREVENECSSD